MIPYASRNVHNYNDNDNNGASVNCATALLETETMELNNQAPPPGKEESVKSQVGNGGEESRLRFYQELLFGFFFGGGMERFES